MQWIYKQIILPRLTYVCHVWGHSLNNEQITKLGSVERLALAYYAPMWKTTPTASLQIILRYLVLVLNPTLGANNSFKVTIGMALPAI